MQKKYHNIAKRGLISFFYQMNVVGKNLVDLYKVVDKSLLPTEYLPDEHQGPSAGPMDKVIGR